MVLNYCSLLGGNTLLWGGRFSEFYRYKVRAFPKKNATKIGQFIYKLLTIIFNLCCSAVEGIFTKILSKFSYHRSSPNLLLLGCSLYRIEEWSKFRIAKIWCFAVVWTHRLTLVATENPPVEWCRGAFASALDCGARNAMRSVDMSLFYSSVRTRLDTATTLSATDALEWFVIFVTFLACHNFAKKDERAVFGGYE
jgi:hypothetical protein